MDKGPDSFRNAVEHCLVEVARVEVLGNWLKLPADMVDDMKMGVFLHDFDKKQEIELFKKLKATGGPQLETIEKLAIHSNKTLKQNGYSARVVWLASAPGGLLSELKAVKNILDKRALSNDDLAFLICHYVDDLSIGSNWILPNRAENGQEINIIDERAAANKKKSYNSTLNQEITKVLGIDGFDAMAEVSHLIEQRLAKAIFEQTGETVDPLKIPEFIDEKIKQASA
ncbi:hypothetical protein HY085_00030 [Candidatus Gottesmanbacteria bacterium]|nr:hypothetical protein [Candidatus Gottesmanbacteria bacterium]